MEIFEKAKKLEDQNVDLEKQIDLVLSAKNNLEKILNEERKATLLLKKQIEESQNQEQEATSNDESERLQKELEALRLEEKKFEEEMAHMQKMLNEEKGRASEYEAQIRSL